MVKKILYIDTETTGISTKHGLVEIAAFLEFDGKEVDRFHAYARPYEDDLIHPDALKANGLSAEEIKGFEEPKKVHKKFTDWLSEYVDKFDRTDKCLFCAYNARFDADHMRAWFKKAGDKYFGSWFWNPAIDSMMLAALDLHKDRAELEDFKQASVAQFYGINVDASQLHGAVYDCELNRRIFKAAMVSLGGGKR